MTDRNVLRRIERRIIDDGRTWINEQLPIIQHRDIDFAGHIQIKIAGDSDRTAIR